MATKRTSSKAPPAERGLTLRDLNRATLARQFLLAREAVPVTAAVRRLVGLQAQLPGPPYVGLWSRLAKFQRHDLSRLIDSHAVVRAPLIRGTLHVATAADYVQFRPVMQPVLSRGFRSVFKALPKGFELDELVADARRLLLEGPRTFEEVRAHLARLHPKLEVRAMGFAVRTHLPLVQVPEEGPAWGFPSEPSFALAETWLGKPIATSPEPRALVLRYLEAFGPATAGDVQTWSGLQGLRHTLEALRPELRVLTGPSGRELFDLPDAPLPPGDAPAPPRFLPEYDNLVLGHTDRERFVPDAFRKKIFLPGLRVAPTFLVDGFVHGVWKLERAKKTATLVIEPLAPLAKKEREALAGEGERLLAFVAEEAGAREVRFEKG